ncbi:hypothetical protein ACFQE8_23730 [Salinirubellus sp. GCM10025818]|jgi:hypothetical protein|uniref:hypothetical protein n=1 Tax=Salinirubellus TaxID=2162630 RepID=UPI0030CB7EDF
MGLDWPAVGAGVAWGVGYLALLSVPVFSALRWAAVPLVLASGLLAGAAAGGLARHDDDEAGGRHGFTAGLLTGTCFAVGFWVALSTPGFSVGVFHGFNYLLATSAGRVGVIATHGPLVVSALAVLGGATVAGLGYLAGREAPRRGADAGFVEP